ncbi:hypothetical protein [Aquabacterium sp. CECT 9606]|uniref:hypothetical protein n=1 Tax=Aquabacterium sp. CECT 9606 TaxID=2845822 RepID=UPI001E31B44C|nr:hypothetical protein [Aquabacterium sp. CECT 9606]CAH0354061.1 hypothetical protein AQB9606_03455 [Aquabacterium sp. CECT 9606]
MTKKSSTLAAATKNDLPEVIPPGMRKVTVVNFSPLANDSDQANAAFWLDPATAAASVIAPFSKPAMPDINSDALVTKLHESMKPDAYKEQSLAMLYGQAMALQTIFVELSRRGIKQDALLQYEAHMKLAMKAQNQCRMTLESLAAVQNPPVVYAKQANFANGHQQVVNNGAPAQPTTPTAKPETTQNQLLEESHGERLDLGAKAKAGGADPLMAAMGEVHRPQDAPRQGKRLSKRVQGQSAPA